MNLPRLQPARPGVLLLAPVASVLLLALFYAGSGRALVVQPGVTLALPPSPFVVPPARGALVVSIVSGTAPRIFVGERAVSLDELDQALRQAAAADAEEPGTAARTLLLRADRGVAYETVFAVAGKAVARRFTVVLAAAPAPPPVPAAGGN